MIKYPVADELAEMFQLILRQVKAILEDPATPFEQRVPLYRLVRKWATRSSVRGNRATQPAVERLTGNQPPTTNPNAGDLAGPNARVSALARNFE